MIEVELTFLEVLRAGTIGLCLQARAWERRRRDPSYVDPARDRREPTDGLVLSAIAEEAAAKATGWELVLDGGRDGGDLLMPDGSVAEVKHTHIPSYGICLQTINDKDDRPYLLVDTYRAPLFQVVGYHFGRAIRAAHYYRSDPRSEGYYVMPRADLRPIEELL